MENNDRTEELKAGTDGDEAVRKVYEVGYHVVPLVAEENLAAEVGNLKGMLESHGALFISEEFPKLRPLAYDIAKHTAGRNQTFDQAYFGWVKFEMTPAEIVAVKKELDGNSNILRYLIVETVRENTMTYAKPAFRHDGEEPRAEEQPKEITAEDEEKVSQAIDELVKE